MDVVYLLTLGHFVEHRNVNCMHTICCSLHSLEATHQLIVYISSSLGTAALPDTQTVAWNKL